MTPRRPKDDDAMTVEEAAALLGCGVAQVYRFRRDGLLSKLDGYPTFSRTEVEAIRDDPWLSGREASEVLGVSHARVSQLANRDRIPVYIAASGRRYYRMRQLAVVANARDARRDGFSIN